GRELLPQFVEGGVVGQRRDGRGPGLGIRRQRLAGRPGGRGGGGPGDLGGRGLGRGGEGALVVLHVVDEAEREQEHRCAAAGLDVEPERLDLLPADLERVRQRGGG